MSRRQLETVAELCNRRIADCCRLRRQAKLFEHALLVAATPPLDEYPVLKPADLHATNRHRFTATGVAHQRTAVRAGESVSECDIRIVGDETRNFEVQVWKSGNHVAEERFVALGAGALPRGRVVVDCIFGHKIIEKVELPAVHGVTKTRLGCDVHFFTHVLSLFVGCALDGFVWATEDHAAVSVRRFADDRANPHGVGAGPVAFGYFARKASTCRFHSSLCETVRPSYVKR